MSYLLKQTLLVAHSSPYTSVALLFLVYTSHLKALFFSLSDLQKPEMPGVDASTGIF
jgi:hypothetical protein